MYKKFTKKIFKKAITEMKNKSKKDDNSSSLQYMKTINKIRNAYENDSMLAKKKGNNKKA